MSWMVNEPDENDSAEELVGTILSQRYEIKKLIGVGGYGSVFEAFDKQLERPVAVKIPHSHRPKLESVYEAKVAAKFQTDGIVSVHDVGEHEGIQYIVSELIEGTNLRQYAATKKLDWKASIRLVASVATSLQKAHDSGHVHRDIKPENILIDEAGQPHITDFGICTTRTASADVTSGTLAYMAPEQIAGESQLIDHRCDVFSLGVVLFELLTGSHPHASQNAGKIREQVLLSEPDFSLVAPECVQGVCKKALSKHPSARQQSASDLADALRDCLSVRRKVNSVWAKPLLFAGGVAGLLFLSFVLGSFWQASNWSSLKGGEIFDGTKRIVTDVDSFAPCTIEAWIAPSNHDKQQWIVGSDIPSKFGIGIGIKQGHPMLETIKGGVHDPDTVVPVGQWSHLAGVFGETETRLYLNGKLVATCPATQPPTEPTKFVVGNLGEKNRGQYFNGRIRSVRISKGEVYDGDFAPQHELQEDDSTVFVFGNKGD